MEAKNLSDKAVAVYCPHDVLYGAHLVNPDDVQDILDSASWLQPRPGDYLRMVNTEDIRLRAAPCSECGMLDEIDWKHDATGQSW